MSSLTALNNYSNNTITFTDNRPAGILLSYPTVKNIPDFVAESSSFAVERKIDIVEIIDPAGTLNLTFSVDLSSVPGATLTWTTLFSGSITSEVNQVYSVRAINSIADWDFVKAPTITLPDDFQGSFEYTCSLTYLASSGLTTKSWTVGTFVPVVNLSAQFTQTTSPIMFKGIVNEEFTSSFTLLGGGLEFDIAEADFASSFNMVSNVSRPFRGFTSTQTVDTNISASLKYLIGGLSSNLNTNVTMVTQPDDVIPVISPLSSSNWVWRSNQVNYPFGNNTPVIYDSTGSYNYEIQLSCANGDFGTETSITPGTYSISGTAAQLNFAQIRDIAFYPDQGYTRTYDSYETVNLKLYRNGLLLINEDIGFRYVGAGGLVGDNYTFNTSSTWTPTIQEHRYGEMRYLIVAGGGGKSTGVVNLNTVPCSGGGAGGVLETADYTDITSLSYSLTVGTGGSIGQDGTSSSFSGVTMSGGTAGTNPNNSNPEIATVYGGGGNSGNGFTGGANDPGSNSVGNPWAMGGGAGASQNGDDGVISGYPGQATAGDGGNGITSFLYGGNVGVGGGGEGGLFDGAEAPAAPGNGGNGFGTKTVGDDGIIKILTRTKV